MIVEGACYSKSMGSPVFWSFAAGYSTKALALAEALYPASLDGG